MSAAELKYPWANHPHRGSAQQVAEGVYWVTMPMGGSLTHINLYLLEDREGWYVVDTGLANKETEELWRAVFAVTLKGKGIAGVICTHMHPDHTGCAGFITEEYRAPLLMTRAEYYQAKTFSSNGPPSHHSSWQAQEFYLRAGMPKSYMQEMGQMFANRRPGNDSFAMPTMPNSFKRLEDGDVLRIGEHDWQVVVGSGHSPEHACLYSSSLKVLLSGDQILPVITSNVSVHPTEPDANPLKVWMESHDRFLQKIPADTLVLPAHNLPFYGARQRLRQLIMHHEDRMLAIEESCTQPRLARELLPVLFKRELDPRQMMMALGEAIAHLHLLMHRERIERVLAEDGVFRFRSIDPTINRRALQGGHEEPDEGPMMV